MQSKRNRILINVTLTLITLILSVLVSLNSTKSYLEALNQTIFSTQTVSILVMFGTSINFIITLLINFNVYKVLYKLCEPYQLYKLFCGHGNYQFSPSLYYIYTY